MAFESLSETHTFSITGFQGEWLPLIHLYDPDLPLFPLLYFHVIDPTLPADQRPGERDRAFGYIHHVNLEDNVLSVTLAINKDLTRGSNAKFRGVVEAEARARLGLGDPVAFADIAGGLGGPLVASNKVLKELWYKIVDRSFGKSLPFGRMWDGTYGLPRFIASWFSEGGRKGELIQTHFFASQFGERIQTGGGIHADFYLLPSFDEFVTASNPLTLFPKFAELARASDEFVRRFCDQLVLPGGTFSAFRLKKASVGSPLDTRAVLALIAKFSGRAREALFHNYSAFDRGPMRSVVALLMLSDIRNGRWSPDALTPALCAAMYKELRGSYQSPKVIQLYAQQCFGSHHALPIDNWVQTFLKWPLNFLPSKREVFHGELFECSNRWGKIERLIWLASQSRKVHASVASDVLWCIRFGGANKSMRGANPLACKICESTVRAACPSFKRIEGAPVTFNAAKPRGGFRITSSAKNNKVPGQSFDVCVGDGTRDEYSSRDRPNSYAAFPAAPHDGSRLTVAEFLKRY